MMGSLPLSLAVLFIMINRFHVWALDHHHQRRRRHVPEQQQQRKDVYTVEESLPKEKMLGMMEEDVMFWMRALRSISMSMSMPTHQAPTPTPSGCQPTTGQCISSSEQLQDIFNDITGNAVVALFDNAKIEVSNSLELTASNT